MNKFTNPGERFDPRQPLLDCSFKVKNSQFRERIDPRQPPLDGSFKVIIPNSGEGLTPAASARQNLYLNKLTNLGEGFNPRQPLLNSSIILINSQILGKDSTPGSLC